MDVNKRSQGQLVVIDAATGKSHVIAPYKTSVWQLAPGRRSVAFCRLVSIYLPRPHEPLPLGVSETYTDELRHLDGALVQPSQPLPKDVLTDSLRWSPDGRELAFFGFVASRSESPRLYRINADSGHVEQTDLEELDAEPVVRLRSQLEWTAAGEWLFLAARRENDRKPPVTARRDWWVLAHNGQRRCLTGDMKTPPSELWPEDGHAAFVGVADGEIWRVRPNTGAVENLTARLESKVGEISQRIITNSGQDEYPPPDRTYRKVLFSIRKEDSREFALLDLRSGEITPLKKPADDDVLMAFSPNTHTAVYSASGTRGTFIWRSMITAGQTDELMAANTFLRDIAAGEPKSIEYTGLDGRKLNGWILLPPTYEPGKRYPLLTWVYPGAVQDPKQPPTSIASGNSLNLQLAAARGYAVLFPSVPLAPEGSVDDPMLRLPEGVLPAVDKAVELGFADPDRLFVMGQSFGGFATYGLVTQTNRFKAAVSLAGMSNLIGLYGTFDARHRYSPYAHETMFMQALIESAQIRMGNPPWKDLGRYLRNSPIFSVDRVQTPLMIIQGDVDYVALQQGEEFFVSLCRQGKRAQFVRYWGEGHVLVSPANVQDMWSRISAWLDEFGDISRDAAGALVFEGDRVKPRRGAPASSVQQFLEWQRPVLKPLGK